MLNKYEQNKLHQKAVHEDMETRVDPEAKKIFEKQAYSNVLSNGTRDMLDRKVNIKYILSYAGRLDSWEVETIKRIAERIRKG